MCFLRCSYYSCLYFDSDYPFGDFLEESKFDDLSEFLQSHFQKKNAVNTMSESKIPMHALIFRCGWETNSIHTIFGYLFTSLANDTRCGNALAHWLFKQSNEIYGGTPPSIDDIKTEPESVKLFVNALFVHRTHISQNTKPKNILAATVLRFHGSFIEVIGNELSGKYKDPTHHYFHHKIMSILSESNISKQTFHKWQDEVIAGFNEKNLVGYYH